MNTCACAPNTFSSTAHSKNRAPRVARLAATNTTKENCAAPEAIVMILYGIGSSP